MDIFEEIRFSLQSSELINFKGFQYIIIIQIKVYLLSEEAHLILILEKVKRFLLSSSSSGLLDF